MSVYTNLWSMIVDWSFFGWSEHDQIWVWMPGTLKLAVSQEQIDGINWFLHGSTNLGMNVSEEWIDELSWFVACWEWCNDTWLDWQSYSISQ